MPRNDPDADVRRPAHRATAAPRRDHPSTGDLVAYAPAELQGGAGLRPVRSSLTDREWQTLDLLCIGRTTAGIAADLTLTQATVRTHVKRTLGKLRVHTRADAVTWAHALRRELLDDAYAKPDESWAQGAG